MQKENKTIKVIWEGLKSIKLTLVLFFFLITSSIIGTLIVQKTQSRVPINSIYSPLVIKIFEYFNFFDLYHSTWFILIILLLFINLLVCTIDKISIYIKQYKANYSKAEISSLTESSTNKDILIPNTKKFYDLMEKKFPKFIKTYDSELNNDHYFYSRGKWSIFNPFIIHLGLLIIIMGSIITSIFGYEGTLVLKPGQTTSTFRIFKENDTIILPLGFALKCHGFEISYWDDDKKKPKQYYADLEIIERGKSIDRTTIYVNKPLSHRGINLYQSSYGSEPSFTFLVSNNAISTSHELIMALDEKKEIEAEITLIPIDFTPNFTMGIHHTLGPAVLVHLKEAGVMNPPFWVFKNFPEISFSSNKNYRVVFKELNENHYTVLQVASSPGISLVWMGSSILLLGLFLIYFSSHQRYYIIFNSERSIAKIAFKSNKRLPFSNSYYCKILNLLESG